MKRISLDLLLICILLHFPLQAGEVLIFEDGKSEPLTKGLEFHHGSWKFADGVLVGEQVPTEKHLATIKGVISFDRVKLEWKMKFAQTNQTFLFVAWPATSNAHAMDFTFAPDKGQFAIVRPKSKIKAKAILVEGRLKNPNTEWHNIICIHDGPSMSVTIDGETITASDESFNLPMGPFYLNGGGFNGARFLIKDIRLSAL